MKNQKGITLVALVITIIVMMILVGVTVNIALNGGLISKAKQASEEMEMAEIRERAMEVKAVLIADAEQNNATANKKTFENRLKEEFEGSRISGDKVVVYDEKYDIKILDSDLNIEVVRHTDDDEVVEIASLDYTTKDTVVDGNVYATTLYFNINCNYTQDEYINKKKEGITAEDKKKAVLQYYSQVLETEITSVENLTVVYLNTMIEGLTHNTIEEWLTEPKLLETLEAESVTKEQLYSALYADNPEGSITEDEVIEALYENLGSNYAQEYYNNTNYLKVYVIENGEEVELPTSSSHITKDEPAKFYYSLCENGTYTFIVRNGQNEEVAREEVLINNIPSDNLFIVAENQGWNTINGVDAAWRKTTCEDTMYMPLFIGNTKVNEAAGQAFDAGLTSNDYSNLTKIVIPEGYTTISERAFQHCENLREVVIPSTMKNVNGFAFGECTSLEEIIFTGSIENVSIYGEAFNNCTSLRRVVLPDSLTAIGSMMFYNCTSLKEITIPNSVTYISNDAFQDCSDITIKFAPGDNPIPDGVDGTNAWGATNATVIKLEQ